MSDIYGRWENRVAPEAIAGMMFPVRCTHCDHVYDLASVTVLQRYADCSVWQCPGSCRLQVDDRGETGWTSRRDYVRLNR